MAIAIPGEVTVHEALAFVAEHPHLFLLTRRADGYPTGYAMMSRVSRGTVSFSTYRASARVTNLLGEGVGGILAMSKDAGDDRVLVEQGDVSVDDGSEWFDDEVRERPAARTDFGPS